MTKTDADYEITTMAPGTNVQPGGAVVSAAYASALLDYLTIRGLDPAQLYAHARLPSARSIAARGQVALSDWMRMFDIAAHALNDPDLALKAGAHINIRHMGVLGQVLMNCATVAEAATQLARYIRLLGEFGEPRVEAHGDRAHLLWTWPHDSPPPRALVQFMQAARAGLTRWLTSRPDLKADAYFFFAAPADTRIYAQIFGGELFFEQPVNQLVVPLHYLQMPIVLADARWRQRAELDALELLDRNATDGAFLQRLKTALTAKLELGRASLDEASRDLGFNPRTLQRKLDAEGTTFRRVLDEVRLTRARHYLRDPGLRLADVAFLLGYSEQSAFQYAFKQWTGQTPGQYRAHALPQRDAC